jgi:putative SbcD/Mre11-related phosphoesterase
MVNYIYGAEIVDLAVRIHDYLIIGDLHLGYEEALNYQGVMVPKFQYPKIIQKLEEIRKKTNSSKIIINGDLKHEFFKISRQEWKETLQFIDFLRDRFKDIILIKGNHDPLTPIIANKTDLEVHREFELGDFLVMHGDKIPDNWDDIQQETIIIGHEHPAIGLRSGERLEKMKCYLKGTFRDKNLLMTPSFNFITEGSDILHEKPLSPFLKDNILNLFEVIGVENFETLHFGYVKDLIKFQEGIDRIKFK